jgi:hypothetical protein
MEARSTCRELLVLLTEENNGLARHDVAVVESRMQHKKRLTLRLEQLLADIKERGGAWKSDDVARRQAILLADEMRHFQTLARNNAILLKAAHQLRADIIIAIRDAVDSLQPRAQLYGANGMVSAADSATRLVARTI